MSIKIITLSPTKWQEYKDLRQVGKLSNEVFVNGKYYDEYLMEMEV